MTPAGRGSQSQGLAVGSRLGPYEIASLIAAGGMGEVYRATDTRLGRDVAIKVLPAEFASDADRLRRFEHEARAVATLNHPNILAIHDIGVHEGAPYFVTELLEGETVRAALQRGAMKPRVAMELAVQIAQGLATAHEKGIVHRDLKPGNVFITEDGHVRILDFGLAKAVPPATREERANVATLEEMTDAGKVMGTAAYMSPEQVRGVPVDHRSDIFSLGVVLYEMVTGKQAFARDSTTETMAAILKEDPPDPTSVSAVVPPALSRAIAHCLEKRPEERFQTARDLAFELKAIVADTTSGKTAPAARARRTRMALSAAIAVVVVGVVAGTWYLRRMERPLRATNLRLLSTFPGSHQWPTFSPDGSMIAFVSDADGSPQIWVKNLAGGDPIRITSGNLNPSHPSWSPRNDQIVFQSGEGGSEPQGLWTVAPLGGPTRRVTELAFAPSFSADGSKLAYHRDGKGVFVCNADGTGEKLLENAFAAGQCSSDDGPVFSPDGKLLAMFPAVLGTGDLRLVPVAGGPPAALTTDDCAGGHPAWSPDGPSIIFSSARKGSRNLWRIVHAGEPPEPITTGAGDDDQPAVSRDGSKLVYTNVRNTYALMALDVATGQSRQILEQRTPILLPIFSPKGDWVAFFSTDLARHQEGTRVFLVASDGTRLQRVTSGTSEVEIVPGWSADGQSVYFLYMGTGSAAVGLQKVVLGGSSTELWVAVKETEHGELGAIDLSPDGRRIAFGCQWKDKPRAAYVRDLATGSMTKLPVPLGNPQWSHDGRFLIGNVYGAPLKIFICPPTGEPCTDWGTGPALMPFWSQDDSEVFVTDAGWLGGNYRLVAVRRDGSSDRPVAALPGSVFLTGFPHGVSSNGMVAWVQLRPGRSELWMADLKR